MVHPHDYYNVLLALLLSPAALICLPTMLQLFFSRPLSILPLTPWFHTYTVAGLTLLVIFAFVFSKRCNTLRLPPGPDRLPLLGNLHNFPKSGWLNTFCSWQVQFGGCFLTLKNFWFSSRLRRNLAHSLDPGNIVYAYVLGDHIIVLNSFKAADDLLTKCGATYSNRPDSVMTEDMYSLSCATILLLTETCPGWVGGVSTLPCSNRGRSSRGAEA